MALPATDAFSGSGAFSANWTYGPTGSNGTSLEQSGTGTAKCSATGIDLAAYWNADSFGNDHSSKFTIVSGLTSGVGYAAVLARCSGGPGTFQGYQLTTDGASGAGHTVIQRWNADVIVDLVGVATTFAPGDVLEIRVSGSTTVTIAAYKNGTLVGSTTDSSGSRIASGGAPGVGGFTSGGQPEFDDWVGDNLAGGTPGNASGAGVIDTASAPAATASSPNTATGAGVTDTASAPTATAGVATVATGAGVTDTTAAPAASAAPITVTITGYRLIDKFGAPLANLTGITAIVTKQVPSSAVAPDKVVTNVSTNGSGVMSNINISDIQSTAAPAWLTLEKDGSPARGATFKVTPVVT